MIEMGLPLPSAEESESSAAAKKTAADSSGLTDGLDDFQLVPKDTDGELKLSGDKLLGHMALFRNRRVGAEPSTSLDLAIGPRQMECINPSEDDIRRGRILGDAGGEGAILKIAKRKLDVLAYVQGYCGNMTSNERMQRLRNQLKLAESLAAIKRTEDAQAEAKKDKEEGDLLAIVETSAKYLADPNVGGYKIGNDMEEAAKGRTIQKKHIAALLLKVYKVKISDAKSKKEHTDKLAAHITENSTKFEEYFTSLGLDIAAAEPDTQP